MKKYILLIINLVMIIGVVKSQDGQLSYKEYRKAAGQGPFPFYAIVGYNQTFFYRDHLELTRLFNQTLTNPQEDLPVRLNGIQLGIGSSIIFEDSKLSGGAEIKYKYFGRTVGDDIREISARHHELALAISGRYALFPLVFQAQVEFPVFIRDQYVYQHSPEFSSLFKARSMGIGKQFNSALRIGFLDPAGTDGGLGVFVEWGFRLWTNPEFNRKFDEFVQPFDPDYVNQENFQFFTSYFSTGVILPIGLRVN